MRPLLLILLLALGLRLALWSQPLHQPANDEVEYITVARDLLAGRGWSFYDAYHWLRAPLYPLWLAASLWLVGGDPTTEQALYLAALPNIVLSTLNVALVAALALKLGGRRAALIAAILMAVLWTQATFASLYMAETLCTFLLTAAFLATAHAVGVHGRRFWVLVLLAGILFGLAALTRSLAMVFIPFAALWLGWQGSAQTNKQGSLHSSNQFSVLRSLVPAILMLGAAATVILPWTIRNTLAYGQVIVVETGFSYNVWVFNEPREDRETIHRMLEAIPNPAQRAAFATEQGMRRLREDPWIVARKLWPNWVYLVRVRPIQDRFLMEDYRASVKLPLFAAALVFDDGLYLLIALSGAAGLALGLADGRARGLAVLLAAWMSYAVASMLLTHGEARYRHFLFPVLIPFAALALSRLPALRALAPASVRIGWAGIGLTLTLWVLVLVVWIPAYPWAWASENLARGTRTLEAEARWLLGDQQGAVLAYTRAAQVQDAPDPWMDLGWAAQELGDAQLARRAYRMAWDTSPLYIAASTRLGDLLREQGDLDGARMAFAGSFADPQRVADWAWRNLDPPPQHALDVGNGLDFGYVGGMYPAETLLGADTRWTNGHGLLRLLMPPGAAQVTLRLAAPWPNRTPVPVDICVEGECRRMAVGAEWRIYRIPFASRGGLVTVAIRSATFDAPDGRQLGVIVDRGGVR